MPTKAKTGISDEAVLKATGKDWAQWCAALNGAGCRDMAHKDIAVVVSDRFGVKPWWSQMVTVGYERLVQGRAKHERVKDYSVSGSRTVNVPVASLYEAWMDSRIRSRWLGAAAIVVRTTRANKSARITWNSPPRGTTLSVNYYAKGPRKSMVQLGHERLKSAADARRMKAFWARKLGALKALLER